MGLKRKKTDDLDSLFGDLGVLEMPEGVDVDALEFKESSKSEDPYARFLPKSETSPEND